MQYDELQRSAKQSEPFAIKHNIDGLAQTKRNTSASAMELRLIVLKTILR